ncbi:mediator of RNA polymerase II transcription subunit 24 [Cimex lectularius]|uniref:Mediator of RNA polymerase II transcription subunit 24 n=1 Tax=Cimex lectularius TaxID=79782 RepID=A0A8I6S1P9_CIMLE|nr:mediator of RNA polymerase II transcription subunit 24 [Cimex lectularius]XP_014254038.1 mediator of RNA polymerase II transcription subunit 24 [Cimex lectularius]
MGVTMESSKVTSKTSSLKALLLRAWRERWSDLQWGIHIKTILPRGVSGDVYNLADCILQQALVGPAPNQLVLSYLKHSLSSQLVSYASVLQRIAKYDGFHKPHCINCLLEFVESIQSGITCRGKPEEGILASAILSLVHWLLQCYHHALTNSEPVNEMLQKPSAILHYMLNCDFLTAMLYLAKHDDKDLYNEVVKKCQEIEVIVSQNSNIAAAAPIQDTLMKLCSLELGNTSLTTLTDRGADVSEPLTYCVQPLLAVQVIQNLGAETNHLANQLRLLQRLKGYKMSRLCCEVIRACLMSLNDALGTSEESKWGAFTFLKLPYVLSALNGSNIQSSPEGDYSEDIVEAIQLLVQFVPLLDLMDSPVSFNCIEALLAELVKLKLLNESHVKSYIARREAVSFGLPRTEINSGAQSQPIFKVIIRAQPTLQRILKTLDADLAKIQDPLPNVLSQVLTGKSFELILAVAAVEGEIKPFVTKLIKFNEYAKTSRPVLFDITFVMLCFIVQSNGSNVVIEHENVGEKSFFEHWVEDFMIERGKPKCPDAMLQQADTAVVDALLAQLNSNQPDFSSIGVGWDVICKSVGATMKEVVLAWEQGALSATDVKRILDNMRQSMCCLPICASLWLCSYMQILHQDALLKPMNMVQQFLSPVGVGSEEGSHQDNFKDRSTLMVQMIRKMQYDMQLATSSKLKVINLSHSIVSKEPMSEELADVWSGVHERGWFNINATHAFESLFLTAGPEWFVTNIVKEIMKLRYKEELNKAVDLALAVFHLNIEVCTEVLLTTVVPQYLHNNNLSNDIVEPQSSAVAKLCAYCTYAAWQSQSSNTRKRPYPPSDDLEDIGIPAKLLHLEEGAIILKGGNSIEPQVPPLNGPLLESLKSLFTSFSLITDHTLYISQQSHFVFRVLEQIVTCGHDQTRPLLQGMPNTLVPNLVRALPNLFSTDLVLRLYDLTSPAGRKATASDLCLLRNLSLKPTV